MSDLREQISKFRWWHSIDLGNGIITPGEKQCGPTPEPYLHFPDRLDGQRVLDSGCWDGAYAFLAEERGAKQVVAIDTWEFTGDDLTGLHPRRETFDLAHRALGSSVKGIQMSLYSLHPEMMGKFDTIFCFGVLYHLRDPLGALEKLRSVCRGTLIVETHVDLLDYPRPAAAFYEGDELNHDPTNWFGPNHLCVLAWLRAAGFSRAELVGQAGSRAAFHAFV